MFRFVNRLAGRTSWAHAPVVAYAKLGIGAFAALLLLGWWLARSRADLDQMAHVVWAGAGTLAALGFNQIVGGLIDRARPYETLTDVHVLVARTTDFSFPSDHAVAVGAVAAGLLLANRPVGLVAVGLALVMAVARVYVGTHYPGDVAAGLALGSVVVILGARLGVPVLRSLLGMLGQSRIRAVVSTRPEQAPAGQRRA